MKIDTLAAVWLFLTLAGAYGIDTYGRLSGSPSSVSSTIAEWSARWPALPFLAGFLCYHLFAVGGLMDKR